MVTTYHSVGRTTFSAASKSSISLGYRAKNKEQTLHLTQHLMLQARRVDGQYGAVMNRILAHGYMSNSNTRYFFFLVVVTSMICAY